MTESRTPIRHSRLRALFEAMKRRDQLDDMDWDLMSEVERDNFAAAIDEVFPLPSETREGYNWPLVVAAEYLSREPHSFKRWLEEQVQAHAPRPDLHEDAA